MTILVTGGAGVIGSPYVRSLLAGGHPGYQDAAITVPDNLTYARNLANLAPLSASPRLQFAQGDTADAAPAGSLVPGRDAMINFAVRWYADNRAWWEPLKRPDAVPAPAVPEQTP
jgi:dTDP-glucose 4,6-dehydratase